MFDPEHQHTSHWRVAIEAASGKADAKFYDMGQNHFLISPQSVRMCVVRTRSQQRRALKGALAFVAIQCGGIDEASFKSNKKVGFMRQFRSPLAQMFSFLLLLTGVPVSAGAASAEGTYGEKLLADVNARIKNISTEELQALLAKDRNLVVIDVRTQMEIGIVGGMVGAPGTVMLPRGWLEFRIADVAPDKDQPIVVYCGTNQRSPLAADTLTRMGYTNVMNYPGGFFEWKKAGLPVTSLDAAQESFLFSKPIAVVEGVWSAIGATQPSTYENSGHNNNLSFVITKDGVLVVNAGGSYLLAASVHAEIKKLTDKPVKYVVLENGQGHAMLGSSYWQEQGATVIAHEDAAEEIKKKKDEILDSAQRSLRDKFFRTKVVMPDETFTDKKVIEMGGERIEILHLGPAHSPGDISVWLPGKSVVIAGDMAFHVRLLPVFEYTDTAGWIESWEKFVALGAKIVIPGHGGPTDYETVAKYTRDYLVYMRQEIKKVVDAGCSDQDAYAIDQSAYKHLDTFEFLALQNAGRIFRSMEFE